jgi:hypothetical protein
VGGPLYQPAFAQRKIMKSISVIWVAVALVLSGCSSQGGGLLDPDCTAEKAAKSAAMKSTIGVGGRCSPAEAAKDTAKRAVQ